MVAKPTRTPLVVIVGETASGKSALALDLAEKYNGEIICADSRTVYREMDIGTAKPTANELARVRHHLLNMVNPGERFTAAEFKRLAHASIENIVSHHKTPFIVGGTGLYVDSVLYDFEFMSEADETLRAELDSLDNHALQQKARDLGIKEGQVNFANRRHLARAIERGGVATQNNVLRPDTLIIGMQMTKPELEVRIRGRVEAMVEAGLEGEVRQLIERYGAGNEALTAIGYKEWQAYFAGEQTLDRTMELITRHTIQYAKRQRTWFKRNRSICWVSDIAKADRLIADFLLQ